MGITIIITDNNCYLWVFFIFNTPNLLKIKIENKIIIYYKINNLKILIII